MNFIHEDVTIHEGKDKLQEPENKPLTKHLTVVLCH